MARKVSIVFKDFVLIDTVSLYSRTTVHITVASNLVNVLCYFVTLIYSVLNMECHTLIVFTPELSSCAALQEKYLKR